MFEPGKRVYRAYLTFAQPGQPAEYVKSLEYRTERGVDSWIRRQETSRGERAYRVHLVTYEVIDVATSYGRRGRPRSDV